jgi:hypothetical protein
MPYNDGARKVHCGRRLLDILTEEPYISKFLFVEVLGIDEEVAQRLHYTFELLGQYTP